MPYRRYFDFSGRSRRLEYWMFTLGWVIAMIVFVIAAVATAPRNGGTEAPGFLVVIGAFVLFALGSIIPSIAVTVRRFHDQNHSGWFYLLGFIPSVGGLILIVFMCIDGDRGENRFGYDPKDPEGQAGVFA